MLWRDGRLPRLWPERPIEWKPVAPKTDWILNGAKKPAKKAEALAAAMPALQQEEPAPDVSVTDLSQPVPPPADNDPPEDAQ